MENTVENQKQSEEEKWMMGWLDECQANGLVESWKYQPTVFKLTDKVELPYQTLSGKPKTFVALQDMEYTPDFEINFTDKAKGLLWYDETTKLESIPTKLGLIYGKHAYVDTKGTFKANASDITAPIKIKFLYALTGTFVQIVVVKKLFEQTFAPQRFLFTPKTGKKIKSYFSYKTIERWMNYYSLDLDKN